MIFNIDQNNLTFKCIKLLCEQEFPNLKKLKLGIIIAIIQIKITWIQNVYNWYGINNTIII